LAITLAGSRCPRGRLFDYPVDGAFPLGADSRPGYLGGDGGDPDWAIVEPKVAILKPLSSAISIGTGGPFGAEGPIIMTGGVFGSLFGRLFQLTSAERKTLLVAGAAAGMSATFGSDLAGGRAVVVRKEPRSFVPVAIAAVVAAVWRPVLTRGGVLFPMASTAMLPPGGLLRGALLGILAGLASGQMTQMVYLSEDFFADGRLTGCGGRYAAASQSASAA
jgi:H+/Cl- antiporter ClcA